MRSRTLAVAVLGLALTGAAGCGAPAPTTAADLPPATVPRVQVEQPAPAPTGPGRLVIPTLDIDVQLTTVGITPTGEHEVPDTAGDVGWYSGGPRPGEVGPALLLGHVDLHGAPGVFGRLAQLHAGDLVQAGPALFEVYDVRQVNKEAFPADLVYRTTGGPELTLVTCGGVFDGSTGHYRDNIVVTARAVPDAPARQLDGG